MKPFYLVTGTLLRTIHSTKNPVHIFEKCCDSDIQQARKRAFEIFDNYKHVINQSITDSETEHRNELDFLQKPKTNSISERMFPDSFDPNFENGICIYFVLNDESYTTKEGASVFANKLLIHIFDDNCIDISNYIEQGLVEEEKYLTLLNK